MARPSNFKGQVVAQGGECRKFALWLKHWESVKNEATDPNLSEAKPFRLS